MFSQRRRVLDENYYLPDVFVKSEKTIPYFLSDQWMLFKRRKYSFTVIFDIYLVCLAE